VPDFGPAPSTSNRIPNQGNVCCHRSVVRHSL